MAKIEIVGVYAVTQEMQDTFLELWDSETAQPGMIADFVRNPINEMIRLDSPSQPYYPNDTEEPDTELWLYAHPKRVNDTDHMIGLYMDVTEQKDNSFKETPKRWLFGKDVTAIVVYKKQCCPQYSVMLCAEFDNGFEFTIHDDISTHEGEKQLFAHMVAHDTDGSEMAHSYAHVKNRDKKCNHHKPKATNGASFTFKY